MKGQARRPWGLSSDSSEPVRGQADLTEKLSEDAGWEGCGGNGGGSEASVPRGSHIPKSIESPFPSRWACLRVGGSADPLPSPSSPPPHPSSPSPSFPPPHPSSPLPPPLLLTSPPPPPVSLVLCVHFLPTRLPGANPAPQNSDPMKEMPQPEVGTLFWSPAEGILRVLFPDSCSD